MRRVKQVQSTTLKSEQHEQVGEDLRLSALGARGLATRFAASHFDGVVWVGFEKVERCKWLMLETCKSSDGCEMNCG